MFNGRCLTLECGFSFFCCFLKDTLVKKKKGHQKKEAKTAFFSQRKTKNVHIPWGKKRHILEKSPLPAIPMQPPLLTIIEHVFAKICQKKMIKLAFFIAISYIFKYFSKSPYVSRIWFANNASKIHLQFFFYFFCKITIYKANLGNKNV